MERATQSRDSPPSRFVSDFGPDHIDDYYLVRKLGEGGFGTTYLGKKNGQDYAVKVLHSRRSSVYFDREVKMMKAISSFCSEYFACAVEVIYGPDKYVIVSDYLKGINAGDLFATPDRAGIFHKDIDRGFKYEYLSFKLLQEVGEALTVLHENDIVHMDVKPENIIYVSDEQRFRLIDFGLAIDLREDFPKILNGGIWGSTDYLADYVYNVDWTDRNNDELLIANDSFALGTTVFVLNEHKFPYGGRTDKTLYNRSNNIGFEYISSQMLASMIIGLTNNVPIENYILYLGTYDKYIPPVSIIKHEPVVRATQIDGGYENIGVVPVGYENIGVVPVGYENIGTVNNAPHLEDSVEDFWDGIRRISLSD